MSAKSSNQDIFTQVDKNKSKGSLKDIFLQAGDLLVNDKKIIVTQRV